MSRILLTLSLAFALSLTAWAASEQVAAAVAKGDAFDRQLKTPEALTAYLEAEKLGGSDAELLRKIAREYALTMPDVTAKAAKLALGQKAVEYAQRAVAKLIYGALPPASYEDAVRNFQKAISLAPQRVAHHIELGRTYAALGQKEQARAELGKGLALPSREKDDAESKQHGRVALAGL